MINSVEVKGQMFPIWAAHKESKDGLSHITFHTSFNNNPYKLSVEYTEELRDNLEVIHKIDLSKELEEILVYEIKLELNKLMDQTT